MKRAITPPHIRLYLIPALILFIGLVSAGMIYLTAGNDSESVSGYEIIGGQTYPVSPQDSKRYQQQLQLYGGKMAVLADGLTRWLAGLWHGKRLAFTVGWIAIALSCGSFFAARFRQADPEAGARDNGRRFERR